MPVNAAIAFPGFHADRSTHDTVTNENVSESLRWGRIAFASLMLFVLFIQVDHSFSFAGLQAADVKEEKLKDRYVDQIEKGDTVRKLMLLSFAAFGAMATIACQNRELNIQRPALLIFLTLFAWVCCSFLWSDDPGLTLRRVIVAGCVLCGSAGLARLLRPTELIYVSLITMTCFVSLSLLLDVKAGGRPWLSSHRFGGTLHPNIQAAYCGVLALAAFTVPSGFASRWITHGLTLYGMVMLYLTQSRTSFLALLIGMMMVFLVRLPKRIRWITLFGFISFAACAMIGLNTLSPGDKATLTGTALMGRTEQAGSLTGRVPLWEELATFAKRKPLTGYGYEAFWTPDRIADIAKSQQWTMQSAHNAYFEITLQLGFIGLALALSTVLVSMNLTQSAFNRSRDAGYAFLYGLIAFGLANSLLESHFAKFKYPSTIALVGLLMIYLYYPKTSDKSVVMES